MGDTLFDPPPTLTLAEVQRLRDAGYVLAEPGQTYLHMVNGPDAAAVTAVAGPMTAVADALTRKGWTVLPPGQNPPKPGSPRKGRTRAADGATSRQGAQDVKMRAGTQAARLLAMYAGAPDGLTDEEAATIGGLLRACFWKRCGELREDGLIEPVLAGGEPLTRPGRAGTARLVCRITPLGSATHARLSPPVD